MRHTDRCPDCDRVIIWAKLDDMRTCYEPTGLVARGVRWNARAQWHESAQVPTYQAHQCLRKEEA